MSPYNEDNTVDSSGYQGYHRSHHRSHTQDSQSEKIEVTIKDIPKNQILQIEKKLRSQFPWKHKGHILIFSLIFKYFSISAPLPLQTLPTIYSLKPLYCKNVLPMVA